VAFIKCEKIIYQFFFTRHFFCGFVFGISDIPDEVERWHYYGVWFCCAPRRFYCFSDHSGVGILKTESNGRYFFGVLGVGVPYFADCVDQLQIAPLFCLKDIAGFGLEKKGTRHLCPSPRLLILLLIQFGQKVCRMIQQDSRVIPPINQRTEK
jgi:hypothetical protein